MQQQLVIKLLEELSLPALPEDYKSNTYHLKLNESLVILIREHEEGFYLHAPLLPVEEQKKEDFFIFTMSANLLGEGTGECIIGLDPSEKFLTLSAEFPYELTYAEFKNKVEDFANYVDYWKEEINKWQTQNKQALI